MNHVYRLIWNAAEGRWRVASELTRACGKCASRALRCWSGALLGVALASAAAAELPTGGQITAGQGAIREVGNALTVTQDSQQLVIDWRTFDIGDGHAVHFAQPGAAAIALNRVLGSDPSELLGMLTATGQVWLVNPHGVLFGEHAQVDVGGLVASTLSLSNADFLSGRYSFERGESAGRIVNHGNLTAHDGGYVALLGAQVSNQGLVRARLGTVALAAGERITLDFAGDALLNVSVDRGTLGALAENHQLLQADGGQVFMSARAADAVLETVVNNTGVIEARTVAREGGVIRLLGGFEGGTVNVAGTLDASAPSGGDGGYIDTSGHKVAIDEAAYVTTAAGLGATGTWLIDPNDYTISYFGGDITPADLATHLASSNVVIQSVDGADTAGAGDIFVNDPVTWANNTTLTLEAVRNIEINANITNTTGGNLVLRADMDGVGVGTILFGVGRVVSMASGRADLYYNPIYSAPTDFSSHIVGTHTAWMLVNDLDDLQAMSTNLAASYALGRDIDAAATASWNGGAGFAPIGSSGSPFTGAFDGLGHTIRNLYIDRPTTDEVGLFGRVGASTIRDVGLLDVEVTGGDAVGALTGESTGGTVERSYATGSVSGGATLGGLVGRNRNGGTIRQSYAAVSVSGDEFIGGLAGVSAGLIETSYATGTVSGNSIVGGLVGYSGGSVTQSYATGAVSGGPQTGGFVGWNDGGSISQSFWDTQTSGRGTGVGFGSSAGASGLTTADMMQQGSFTGWDFAADWWLSAGNTRPFLRSEHSTTIRNAHQLQLMALDLDAVYELAADIDMTELTQASGLWNPAAGFVPIGSDAAEFTGILDGAGHTIRDLYINRPTTDDVGLFGLAQEATISNVGLVTGNVSGRDRVGLLLGYDIDASTIANSYASGDVSGNARVGGLVGMSYASISQSHASGSASGNDRVGGLVGLNYGQIDYSYSTSTVNGGDSAGGLVGDHYAGSISHSYATGAVTGGLYVGGLVGTSSGFSGDVTTIERSYATGSASGSALVGGLVGFGAAWSSVSQSYATGAASGSSDVGGLIGRATTDFSVDEAYASGEVSGPGGGFVGRNDGLISDSFWNVESSGLSWGVGTGSGVDVTGVTTAQLMEQATFAGAGWDIAGEGGSTAAWRIYEGQTAPLLRDFLTSLTVTVDGAAKTYDGVAWIGGSGVAYSGFRAGDSVADLLGTFAYGGTAQGARNAGTYSLRGAGLYSDQQGYDIEYVESSLIIAQRALTIGAQGLDRTYDGTTAATVTLSDDRVAGDELTLTYSAAFGDKHVGADKAVSVDSMVVSGADAANYTWNTTASTTADITRATLMVIGAAAQDRVYDGTTDATISGAVLDGVFGSDAVSLTNATFGSFADKSVGAVKAVSTSMGLSGADAVNYLLVQPIGLSADVSRATLTVSGAAAQHRVYDGTTIAVITGASLAGVIGGDGVTLTNATLGGFADKHAGAGKSVSTAMGLSGADASNYTLVQPMALTADITRRELLVSAGGEDKPYDGTTAATVQLGDDRVNGDELTLGYASAEFADAEIGEDKPIEVLGITVDGTDAGNYVWNTSAQTAADIVAVEDPAASVLLTLDGILPELAGDTRSEVSSAHDLRLINRGIRLPDGVDSGDAQK